jgi:hypothetical protein
MDFKTFQQVCQRTYNTSLFKFVQRFSSRSYSIIVVLVNSEKHKNFRESIFGTIYMSKPFLQGVLKMFIVAVNTSNRRVEVKVMHKNACSYSYDIPFSCMRYYTQLQQFKEFFLNLIYIFATTRSLILKLWKTQKQIDRQMVGTISLDCPS